MSPYSNDLRIKILQAYKTGGQSQRQLAARFGVSLSFVQNLVKLYRETGSIAPKPHGGGQRARIGPDLLRRIAEMFEENPDCTIRDVRRLLTESYGIQVSEVTVYRAVEKLGITKSRSKNPRAPRPSRNVPREEQDRKAKGASS